MTVACHALGLCDYVQCRSQILGSSSSSSDTAKKRNEGSDSGSAGHESDKSGPSSSSSGDSDSSLRQIQESATTTDGSESDSSERRGHQKAESLQLERRRARTAKARAAAVAAKAGRRLAKHAILDLPEHPAGSFREAIKGENALINAASFKEKAQRLRLIVSYSKAWGRELTSFFVQARSTGANRISHSLITSVVDDCNMRLSTITPAAHQWVISRVTAVMNNCQTLILGFPSDISAEREQNYRAFPVFTPLVALPRSNRITLSKERLLTLCGAVPKRFHHLLIPEHLIDSIQIQSLAVCCDALATNCAHYSLPTMKARPTVGRFGPC